jgi:uncharacterized protein YjbJ (UPF0337 family)
MERTMSKDKAKGSADKMRGEEKEKAGKVASDKSMQKGGTAGGLDESTKHGLGKTEDKISDRLKGD